MKISVCVITYNHEKYVEQCLKSIFEQKCEYPVELIISDDCSTDSTRAVIEKSITRFNTGNFTIVNLAHNKNLGFAGNWAASLKACTGNLVAVCEGDDYWASPQKLQKQASVLIKNKQYVGSLHNAGCLNDEGVIFRDYTHHGMASEIKIDQALSTNSWATPSLMYWRDKISHDQIDLLKTAPVIDWILITMLLQKGKMYYFNENMAVYRVHASGYWSRLSDKERNNKRLEILQFIEDKFNLGKKEKRTLNKSRSAIYLDNIKIQPGKVRIGMFENLGKVLWYGRPWSMMQWKSIAGALIAVPVKNK
jgi:glycosyltransferase involved in cell wall biosynthesis